MRFSPGLQGLRGVAALLIVVYHTPLLAGGWISVDVFFVLSGFLVTRLLLAEHERKGRIHLSRFFVRRAARLLPALLVLLVVAGSIAMLRHQPQSSALNATLGFGTNVLVAGGAQIDVLGQLWSLAEEGQFYVLWPLILILALRLRRPWLVAVGLACVSLVAAFVLGQQGNYARVYYGPDSHAFPLFVGCAGAFIAARPRGIVYGLALIPLIFTLYLGSTASDVAPAMALVSLLALGLVLSETPWLGHRWLQRLGDYSYGLYLWHWFFFMEVGTGIRLLVSIPLTLTCAVASYHFIERPARGLVHHLHEREPERILTRGQAEGGARVLVDDRLDVVVER
jgi:peptidoglycan/LPS O-acetylase OafA/YrhL